MVKDSKMMLVSWLLFFLMVVSVVGGYVSLYETKKFKVGIEYDHSLPMYGGSDRYRHRNNYDPFFVTISTSAKSGYVISYLDVTATVDASGEVDFNLIRGQTGTRSMTFQLVSNNSDFLSYYYLAYGIREEEYRKISNIITLPINNGPRLQHNGFTVILLTIMCLVQVLLLK